MTGITPEDISQQPATPGEAARMAYDISLGEGLRQPSEVSPGEREAWTDIADTAIVASGARRQLGAMRKRFAGLASTLEQFAAVPTDTSEAELHWAQEIRAILGDQP
jgi:hypothetical protein